MYFKSLFVFLILLCTLNCCAQTSSPKTAEDEKKVSEQKTETREDIPNFYETLAKRRSVRAYENRAIEPEKIQRILQAINSAPSAGNLQSYEVVIVSDKKILKQLADAMAVQKFVADAQVAFVFFANPPRSAVRYGERGQKRFAIQDATIAAIFAHLSATAEGLGSCIVGAFDDNAVSSALKAPKELIPVVILPMGYPAESPKPRPRRKLDDIIKTEHF